MREHVITQIIQTRKLNDERIYLIGLNGISLHSFGFELLVTGSVGNLVKYSFPCSSEHG